MIGRFTIATELAAPAPVLWAHATCIEGISFELGPWLRMTVPRGLDATAFAARLSDGSAALPARLGRSWVVLAGVVPFDWDDLVITEIEPGRRFLERSTMLSMKSWQHERTFETAPTGTRVVDRLAWEPRALVPAAVAQRIVEAIFRHRHARLAARFRVAPAKPS